MTAGSSYNYVSFSEFPFDVVRSKLSHVSTILRHFYQEVEIQSEHHPKSETDLNSYANFAAALNTVLVWCGARPTTLPLWEHCDRDQIANLVGHLNYISRQISKYCDRISDIIILERPYVTCSDSVIQDSIITRGDNPYVRFRTDLPVEHRQSGRELVMFLPNVDNFTIYRGLIPTLIKTTCFKTTDLPIFPYNFVCLHTLLPSHPVS